MALQLLREQDSFAAIEFVTRQGDALAVVEKLNELMRYLYWEKKDLPGCIALGRAGAQHGLTAAARLQAQNPDLATKLRGKAKAICYNLASFTWSGWDEKDIRITAADEAVGMDAARANLRLARELSREDLALSRAFWILGAHHISAKGFQAAVESFGSAEKHAGVGGAANEELLAAGFRHLAVLLIDPSDAHVRERVVATRAMLATNKEGEEFARQMIDAAIHVFLPSPCEERE